MNLETNQVIVTLGPLIHRILEIEVETANRQKKTNEFTIEKLLVDNYCFAVENGRSYPVRQWIQSEINSIKSKLIATSNES